ncbi:uncharacterized protein LOC134202712 [Armigeres subalbatus]|uniref:uncharacterized protein LOC134202712 n=1 Tax=Armigeres subalbatus TaxID=124917 RepID=UPI002ED297C5
MSLDVFPVCSSCGKYSVLAISCTNCLQICCTACFNVLVSAMVMADADVALLAARVCRKCRNECRVTNSVTGPGNETNASLSVDRSDLCDLHWKERTLYCLNCSVSICGDCMCLGEPHDFHRIDNLVAVYFERTSRLRDKLKIAEKFNDELHAGSEVYRRNLRFIEKEEAEMLEEIEAIAEESRLEVSRVTTVRKQILKEKLNVPFTNGAVLEDMWNTAKQVSPYRLLNLLSEFDANCDKLLAQDVKVTVQQTDDFQCQLIEKYKCTEIVFRAFRNAANGDISVSQLIMDNGVEWRVTVTKMDMILIEPRTVDPRIQEFPHKLLVTIPHKDYEKTIHQSFELEDQYKAIEVVYSSFLVEEGFCRETNGDLVMKIGVRCKNVLSELDIMELQYNGVRDEDDYKHLVMHFHPKLSNLKNRTPIRSSEVIDGKNRQWYLEVYADVHSNKLKAFIGLQKRSAVCCDFFIELIHTNVTKNIVIKRQSKNFNTSFIWEYQFISLDSLNNDCGFSPGGNLHFRFGVRPLSNSTDISAQGASANA